MRAVSTVALLLLGSGALIAVIAGTAESPKPPDPRISFSSVVLTTAINCSSSALADFNGDGKLDFATSSAAEVVWFEMPGRARKSIKKPGEGLDSVLGIAHATLDVDGDGNVDLLAAEPSSQSLVWYECPSPMAEDWKRHLIGEKLAGLHELAVADLDADGKPELVANGNGKVIAYRIPANAKSDPRWEPIEIAKDVAGAVHSLLVVDLTGDGRADLLMASASDGCVAWWERPAVKPLTQPWKRRELVNELPGISHVALADIDGDGQSDLIAACGHSSGLFWYRRVVAAQPAEGKATNASKAPGPAKSIIAVKGKANPTVSPKLAMRETWVKAIIEAEFGSPHALAVADFDDDGKVDIASVSRQSREVAWWENQGQGQFRKRVIAQNQTGYEMRLLDFGPNPQPGKGLLVAGKESNNMVFYSITPKSPPAQGKG